MIRIILMSLFIILFSISAVHAQADDADSVVGSVADVVADAVGGNGTADAAGYLFFAGPLTEILYSRTSPAFGGGAFIGAGDGVSIGLRVLYTIDFETITSLEIGVFIRFYIFGYQADHGPFVQLNAGTVMFARHTAVGLPADVGTISAFVSGGWRFLLGSRFFIEPAIRLGTPYIIGAGASAGVRF
jgi:hypothetical protein